MPRGRACIGTSGWAYDAWGEAFYGGRPERDWLRFCAERFNAIEVNATFYRLQTEATFRRWRGETRLGSGSPGSTHAARTGRGAPLRA